MWVAVASAVHATSPLPVLLWTLRLAFSVTSVPLVVMIVIFDTGVIPRLAMIGGKPGDVTRSLHNESSP